MAIELGPTEYQKYELIYPGADAKGFKYSEDGKRLLKAPGKLKKCVIPEGVEAICDGAFFGRVTYVEIDLPDSVKYIGRNAFWGCERLKRIHIPENVCVIDGAFGLCPQLPANFLPESAIVVNVFLGPTECFKYELRNPLTDADGFKYSRDGKRLLKAPAKLKKCVIPDGVEAICDEAFYGRVSYVEIDLPDSVKYIGRDAFCGCKRLKRIHIPENVYVIEGAFGLCPLLPAIFLPESVIVVKGLTIRDAPDFYSEGEKERCVGKWLLNAPSNITEYAIPEGIETICSGAFSSSVLTKVIFPHSARIVEQDAFYDCPNLETVEFNDELVEVCDGAFRKCDNIRNLLLSEKTTLHINSFGSISHFSDDSLKYLLQNYKTNKTFRLYYNRLLKLYKPRKPDRLDYLWLLDKLPEETGLRKAFEREFKRSRRIYEFEGCAINLLYFIVIIALWFAVFYYPN